MKGTYETVEINTTFKKRKANFGWMKEEVSPNHLCKVVRAPALGLLPIPEPFRPFLGEVPGEIKLRTNTGCVWTITLADVNGKPCLERGWPAFPISHGVGLGYLLMFKKLAAKEYRVIIFDTSDCEIVKKCPEHPENCKKD